MSFPPHGRRETHHYPRCKPVASRPRLRAARFSRGNGFSAAIPRETRLPGYRGVVALIRESGNGDSETFESRSPTPILLSRLRARRCAVRRSLDSQCDAQRVNRETRDIAFGESRSHAEGGRRREGREKRSNQLVRRDVTSKGRRWELISSKPRVDSLISGTVKD